MAEIKLVGLTKKFGANIAVSDVDLVIQNGSFVVLLGPTGAGKTTLLRLISGLDKQDSGYIFADGRECSALTPAERNIAMVFQQYSL